MYPKIKFKISRAKDVESFYCFLKDANYDKGRNLEWAVFNKYSYFKKYKSGYSLKIPKKEVVEFVNNIYEEHADIRNNMIFYQENWKEVEVKYYKLVDEIFNHKFWPRGRYIAYSTIWGMFPRFIEDKTFQIPAYRYKNIKYVNVIIAHEMLHFIFYNYFYKEYPKYKDNKYSFLVWHASEIFNVIIQNSAQWLSIFKIETMPYPEHIKIIVKIKKSYQEKEGWKVNFLIQDILDELKKSTLV